MKKLLGLGLGLFLMICVSSLSSSLPLEMAKPDLGVPFIIYAIFFLSPVEGLAAAVLFGFTAEVLSASPKGGLLFTTVGLLLACVFLKKRLYIESRYTFGLVCAASVIMESATFAALSLIAKGETKYVHNVLVFAVPDAIVTGFVSLFMFDLFERLKIRRPGRA
jgi:rod shape-determining protein MreD